MPEPPGDEELLMQIQCSTKSLSALLNQVGKVVNSRNTIPVLGCVKLALENGMLTATASNLDIEITGGMGATGDNTAICVDAKLLTGIIAKLPGDTATIDIDGSAVTVKAGKSRFKLSALPVEDFPSFSANGFSVEFTADLSALTGPVKYAISSEQTRYYLCGVYLEGKPDALVLTATDGHRMATLRAEPSAEFTGVIVPSELVAILPRGDAKVSLSDRAIRIDAGSTTIVGRLIDGSYPDYERVIPKNELVAVVDGGALRDAVSRVMVIGGVHGNGVKLSVSDGEIALTTRSEGREATDSVPCTFSGEPFEIGFNATYLVDTLTSMPAGDVRIAFAGGNTPPVFTSAAAEGLRAIVMPMRVG